MRCKENQYLFFRFLNKYKVRFPALDNNGTTVHQNDRYINFTSDTTAVKYKIYSLCYLPFFDFLITFIHRSQSLECFVIFIDISYENYYFLYYLIFYLRSYSFLEHFIRTSCFPI